MKKVVSILLALVMVLGMVSMAMALGYEPTKANFGVDGYPDQAKVVRAQNKQLVVAARVNANSASVSHSTTIPSL